MNKLSGYRVLCGAEDPFQACTVKAMMPFSPEIKSFLSDLSAALLSDRRAKDYPDVVTFAFFCRRANLELMEKAYDDLDMRLGRGMVFHIAPGNVPMNFAYSMVSALLAGNASIVKVPSKPFEQVSITCEAIHHLLADTHTQLAAYACMIEYPRERQDLTETFSEQCNVRVIWGGDETIRRVRQAPLAPRAYEITFADRWSLAVLDAETIAEMDDGKLTDLANGFYNDTYLFDQNACTAPKLCYWLGEGSVLQFAKTRFYNALYEVAAPRYPIEAVTAVDKQMTLCRAAVKLDGVYQEKEQDNLITRIHLGELSADVLDIHCTGGCFQEYDAKTLSDLEKVLTEKVQTIACAGVDLSMVRKFVKSTGVKGIDRVVKIGHTMDYSLVWDGYDLIRQLSRKIE